MKKVFENIGTFFREKVRPITQKIKHALTHNFILRYTSSHVVVFSVIRIKATNKRREAITGLTFIFIWIVGYLIFSLYPIFYSLYLSAFKVKLDGQNLNLLYLGFENFKAAFISDATFVELLLEYVIEMAIRVPVVIVFALIIAMLINTDVKGKGIWRTIFFLPVIIASGPIISELIDQGATTLPSVENYDVIVLVLQNIGDFIANPVQNLLEEILYVLWFSGIQILILLAGLQKIDKSIYEASMIDGAGPWESFWKITLPSIMPLISVTVVYTVVSMSVFSLNEVILYIQDRMFIESTNAVTNGYGYASALAWIYFITMVIIIGIFVGLLNIKRRSRR